MEIDWDSLPLVWQPYTGADDRGVFAPGDILRLRDGKKVLVGEVNQLLGVCDDCTEFQHSDIEAIADIRGLLGLGEKQETTPTT